MINKLKIISFILIFLLCTLSFSSLNYAKSPDEVFQEAEDFIGSGSGLITVNPSTVKDASSTIYNLLFTIGIVVAVAVGAVIGIKFMIASAEDKASIKEALIPYVVGCIVVFGAFGIWKLVLTLGQGIG